MRIELTSPAWEAGVIPLYDTRLAANPAVRSIGPSSYRNQPIMLRSSCSRMRQWHMHGNWSAAAPSVPTLAIVLHRHHKLAGACDFERFGMPDGCHLCGHGVACHRCNRVTSCYGSSYLRTDYSKSGYHNKFLICHGACVMLLADQRFGVLFV